MAKILERRKEVALRCVDCGRVHPFGGAHKCSHCSGLLDPEYDLSQAELLDSTDSLQRYFHLLPLQCLPVRGWARSETPCVHSRKLGRRVGLSRLFLKDETAHTTGTTKDRMAACVLAQCRELGIAEFVASSTGNSSTSFAYGIRFFESIRIHLFAGREFVKRHAHCDHPRIEFHVLDSDFVGVSTAALDFAKRQGIHFEGGFFNPARREGLKLAYLEAFDQMPFEPTVVVQAVSSGMGVYGAFKGVREYQAMGRLEGTPRIVCAQQSSCAPMVRAWKEGCDVIEDRHIVKDPHGLAEAILRGDPSGTYPYMRRIVDQTNGCFEQVDDTEIRQARRLLRESEGIEIGYSSATALAVALKLRRDGWVTSDDVVLVNLTGKRREALAVKPAPAHRRSEAPAWDESTAERRLHGERS